MLAVFRVDMADQRSPRSPLEAAAKRPHTRSEFKFPSITSEKVRVFNLGHLAAFSGKRLPNGIEVLQRYFKIRSDSHRNEAKRVIAGQIVDELEQIYAKGPFAMKKRQFCIDQVVALFDKHLNVLKSKSRLSEEKATTYLTELKKLFDLFAPDAEKQIQNDRLRSAQQKSEDIAFLRGQKEGCVGHFSTEDKVYSAKQASKQLREKKASDYKSFRVFQFM